MRRMVVTSAILVFAWLVVPALAQSKSARGTVTAMSGDTVTVKAGTQELKFTVDATTRVVGEGAGTASRAAEAKGATGPKLAEVLKVGDNVEVSYRDSSGMLHATTVQRSPLPVLGAVARRRPRPPSRPRLPPGR